MGNEYYYSGGMDSFGIVGGEEAAVAGVVGIFFLVYGLIMLFAMAFSIATYVLHSLGLYTIAQRRRIRKPWLAWIPVGNLWLLGSISDQYQYLVKGKVKSRRKVMLGLSIGNIALYFLWIFCMILSVVMEEIGGAAMVGSVLMMLLGLLAFFGIAIALTVYQYMCYYDLYSSCEKNNGVLYLILSILFSAIMPFLVFACRKKDDGMPPRKQPAPAAEPVVEIVEEPEAEEIAEETEGEPENEQEVPVADD